MNNPLTKPLMLAAFVAAALACTPASAAHKDDLDDLLDMSSQFDKMDKQDFQAAIDRANGCTRARDFSCSERELARAAKAARSGQDKKALAAARQGVADEKARIAEEDRLREEERQLAEERAREREWQARRKAEKMAKEHERQARRDAKKREEQESAQRRSEDLHAFIEKSNAEHAALVANIDRQTKANERQIDREAEQRKEAQQRREAQQSRERLAQADARDRKIQQRLAAERADEQQRQEREAQQRAQQQREAAERLAKIQAEKAAKQQAEQRQREADRLAKEKAEKLAVQEEKCILQGTGICRGGAVAKTAGGNFVVTQPNGCGYRLYVEICIKKKSGGETCGSESASPGGKASHWHPSDDSTGSFTVNAVGVLKGGSDWNCMAEKKRLGAGD